MPPIDWSHLRDAAVFHDLLNELFLAELNHNRCYPGAPRRGKDHGFDLAYRGAMPTIFPGLPAGRWMLQAKFTAKDLTPACNYLKRELLGRKGKKPKKGEIEKAREAKVDYLLLLTQAELQPAHATDLEALVPTGQKPTIKVMYRQKLEERLAPKAWLLHRYFGVPTFPGLEPVTRYQDGSETLPLADLPFLGRDTELSDLQTLVTAGTHRVLLVHGPGGRGKTRFLREAAGRAHSLFPERQVYFFNGLRSAQDTIQNELPPGPKYLVMVDDAERGYAERTQHFMRLSCAGDADVVFVLSCREGALDELEAKLRGDGVHNPGRVVLYELSRDTIFEALRQKTALDDLEQSRLYRATSGNLFLLSAAVKAIEEGSPPFSFATAGDIKGHLVQRLQEQADMALTAVQRSLPRELLPALALLVPFSDSREEEREYLGALIGEPDADEFLATLDVLHTAGVLRRVGWKTRFAADMLGDFILDCRLDQPDRSAFLRKVVGPAVRDRARTVVNNLAHAGGLGNEVARRTLTGILKTWTAEEAAESTTERDDRIEAVRPMAHIVPDQVIEFLEAVVMAPDPPPERQRPQDDHEFWERALKGERWVEPLTTDKVSPALIAAGKAPRCMGRALELLRQIKARIDEGMYDNHKPISMVAEWLSPVNNGPDTIKAALSKLGQWLADPEPDEVTTTLVFVGIRTVLRTRWQRHESEGGKFIFGSQVLPNSEPMRQVREQAMEILTGALVHPCAEVRRSAVNAADKIGESQPSFDSNASPLRAVADEEKSMALEIIAARLPGEQDLGVLHAMEEVLLHTWLMESAGSDAAERALSAFAPPTELKVLRWSVKPWDGFDTFEELKRAFDEARQQIPDQNRWSWWVRRKHAGRSESSIDRLAEAFQPLVAEIEHCFPGVDGFIALLNRVAAGGYDGSGGSLVWGYAVASRSPKLLDTCLHDPDVAPRIPAQFVPSLRSIWSATASDAFAKTRGRMPDALRDAAPSDVLFLLELMLWAKDRPDKEVAFELLAEAAGHPDQTVRITVVDWHVHRYKVPAERATQLCARALASGYNKTLVKKIWDEIEYGVMGQGHDPDRTPLREVVTQVFLHDWDVDDSGLHNLLLWCLRENTKAWLDLLERRLRAERKIWGLGLLSDRHGQRQEPVHSVDDLRLALERLDMWLEEGLLEEYIRVEMQKWLGCRDFAATNAYIEATVVEHREKDYPTCARLLSDRGFGRQEQELWLGLLPAVHGTACWTDIAQRFVGTAGFIRTYSGTRGQDPPALTGRLKDLQSMLENVGEGAPHIARLLKDAIQIVEDRIAGHRREEQEVLDPR